MKDIKISELNKVTVVRDKKVNMHDIVHGKFEYEVKQGETLIIESYTKRYIILEHKDYTVRILGQKGYNDDCISVYGLVIEEKNAGITYNMTIDDSDNTQLMRDMRQSCSGNGKCLNRFNYKSTLQTVVMNGDDFRNQEHYHSDIRDIQEANNVMSQLTTKKPVISNNLPSESYLKDMIKRSAEQIMPSYKVEVVEQVIDDLKLQTLSNKLLSNYTVSSWDDDMIKFSSGLNVKLSKEKAKEFIESGFMTIIGTPYGNIRHEQGLLICGCHRIKLSEIEKLLGIEKEVVKVEIEKSDNELLELCKDFLLLENESENYNEEVLKKAGNIIDKLREILVENDFKNKIDCLKVESLNINNSILPFNYLRTIFNTYLTLIRHKKAEKLPIFERVVKESCKAKYENYKIELTEAYKLKLAEKANLETLDLKLQWVDRLIFSRDGKLVNLTK